jgi:hypothetical protein
MINTVARPTAAIVALALGLCGRQALAQQGWVDLPPQSVLVSQGVPPTAGSGSGDAQGDGGPVPGEYAASVDDGWQAAPIQGGAPYWDGVIAPLLRDPDVYLVGRTDALIAWRNAPPGRPIVDNGLTTPTPVLNADGMDSPAAAGPRFSIFRFNDRNETALETTYFQLANWQSVRPLAPQPDEYALAPPGIYGNTNTFNFTEGLATLGASMKSLEANRHWWIGEHVRFLAGFRWVEWQENFSLSNEFIGQGFTITDIYQTACMNSLYGGQIGLDGRLFSLSWMRCEGLVKAGAFYNNGVQRSLFVSNSADPFGPLLSQAVSVNQSPVSGSFLGEVGITGYVPLTDRIDVSFGYSGWWLSGIVQPTQQLSGQVLTQPAGGTEPTSGTINADGGVIVQAVTLGLEGRW